MTTRTGPQDFSSSIRSILDRLTLLESRQGENRQNTVVLGNWVIEAEDDKRLKMTNRSTKEVTYAGDQVTRYMTDRNWSYSGTVSPGEDTQGPKWSPSITMTVTHIILQLNVASSHDLTVETLIGGSRASSTVLKAGVTRTIQSLDLVVSSNSYLSPLLLASPDGSGETLAITYWLQCNFQGEFPEEV